jgi:hypothetical protein
VKRCEVVLSLSLSLSRSLLGHGRSSRLRLKLRFGGALAVCSSGTLEVDWGLACSACRVRTTIGADWMGRGACGLCG